VETETGQLVTQAPAEQQPPLHGCVPEHKVVHAPVDVSHDSPDGQLAVLVQKGTHVPPLQAVPLAHANAEPQPPQLLLSVVSLTHALLHTV
jgi:hypothetical protein